MLLQQITNKIWSNEAAKIVNRNSVVSKKSQGYLLVLAVQNNLIQL